MRDEPTTTIARLNHDEVLKKFWLGAIFSPAQHRGRRKTSFIVPTAWTLEETIRLCDGDVVRCAAHLGVARTTFQRWMRKRGVWIRKGGGYAVSKGVA